MSLIRGNEIDLSQKASCGSHYRYSKIYRNSGTGDITMSLASTQQVVFDLPVKCMNLSKSWLDFDIVVPLTAASYNSIHLASIAPINSVQLSTRSGMPLCNLNNVAEYTKVVLPVVTPFEEYRCLPEPKDTSATIAAQTKHTSGFSPSNELVGNTISVGINTANGQLANNPGVSYTCIAQNVQSTVGAALCVRYHIPLKQLAPHTIFSLNKTLYFDDVLMLTLTLNPANKFSYLATAADNSAGIGPAAAPVLSNLSMTLAIESNVSIASSLVQKVHSGGGLNLTIPYVHSASNATSTGSNAVALRINRQMGKNLLRVYHALFNRANSTYNYALDCSNIGSARMTDHYSTLNYIRLSDATHICADNDDYNTLQEKIRGSAIQNNLMYKFGGNVWLEDFTMYKSPEFLEHDDEECGVPLNEEQIYSFNCNSVTDATQLTFAVVQKHLQINAGGNILVM